MKIVKEAGAGLGAGHEEGMVHRDVKPGNILFNKRGEAVIADFGLAKALQVSASTASITYGGGVGTPYYQPPELWNGSPPPSPATDVYSLACVFYEIVTGEILFNGDTPMTVMTKHARGPEFSSETKLSASLLAVLKNALQKEPANRPQDMDVFVSELEKDEDIWSDIGGGKKAKGDLPAWVPWVGAVVLGVALVIAGWLLRINFKPQDPIATRVNPNDLAVMVYVPKGEFVMGTNKNSANEREKPEHIVFLDNYYIYQHEVTNAQFSKFINSTGYETDAEKFGSSYVLVDNNWEKTPGVYWAEPEGAGIGIVDRESHPVVHVSWNDAQAYCRWAGARLPTEAEWEKAARGTDRRVYPWGNTRPNCEKVNYSGCVGGTTSVGRYPLGASPYGAMDMAGNVFEWVSDWYQHDYYQLSNKQNPTGPDDGAFRIYRGGAWTSDKYNLRVMNRPRIYQETAMSRFGFRCAASAGNRP
jgi:formylglycine-generating enzyme required for sulfatase activity